MFETEITELKRGRRKGQRVINLLEAAWAKPETSEAPGHLCYRQEHGEGATENRVRPLCLR